MVDLIVFHDYFQNKKCGKYNDCHWQNIYLRLISDSDVAIKVSNEIETIIKQLKNMLGCNRCLEHVEIRLLTKKHTKNIRKTIEKLTFSQQYNHFYQSIE